MWLHQKSYLLDCKFMVKINKICIINCIYSWEKRFRVVQSGKVVHLCTHRHAPGSTRIQSLLYLLSLFTALLTSKKISKQAEKHLVQVCTKVGSCPLKQWSKRRKREKSINQLIRQVRLVGCPRSSYSIEAGRRKQNKYFLNYIVKKWASQWQGVDSPIQAKSK